VRFVEVKSQTQSDLQALHRARERSAPLDQSSARVVAGARDCGAENLEEQLSILTDEDEIEALSPRIRLLNEHLRAKSYAQ
jgi:transposase